MYNSLPYISVYDTIIDQRLLQVFADQLNVMSAKPTKLPRVTKTIITNGKPREIQRAAVTIYEILLSHAQRIARVSDVPQDVILKDLTEQYTLAIRDCADLLLEVE